jgi:hypothetical protein
MASPYFKALPIEPVLMADFADRVRPNQVNGADECHDETILRMHGRYIVRVPCSLEEVLGWLGP